MIKMVDNILQIGYQVAMFADHSIQAYYFFYYTWRGTSLPMD